MSSAASVSSAGSAGDPTPSEMAMRPGMAVAGDGDNIFDETRTIELGVFGVLYTVSKEKTVTTVRFAIFRMFLDFLQLWLLVVNPIYGWTINADNRLWKVVSFLQLEAFLSDRGYVFFLALFYTFVAMLCVNMGLSVWVAQSFSANRFDSVWPIRFLRWFGLIFYQVLDVATLTLLLMALNCNYGDATINTPRLSSLVFEGRKCFAMPHILHVVVSVTSIIVFLIMATLMVVSEMELNPLSRHYLAIPHTRVEGIGFFIKIIVTIGSVMIPNIKVLSLLYLIFFGVLMYINLKWVPFTYSALNYARCASYATVLYSALLLVIMEFARKEMKGETSAFQRRVTNAMWAGMAPAAMLGVGACHMRLRFFLVRVVGRFRDAAPDTPAKRIHCFSDAREVAIAARCCRVWVAEGPEDAPDPAAAALSEAVIKAGMTELPSDPNMIILYSSFLIDVQGSYQSGYTQLQNAKRLNLGLLERFAIFSREQQHIQKASGAGGADGGTVDLVSYVEFQRGHRLVTRAHKAALLAMRAFWGLLLRSKVDSNQLSRALQRIELTVKTAERAYRSVLVRHANSARVVRLYGKFLEGVKFDPWAASCWYAEADRLDEEAERARDAVNLGGGVEVLGVGGAPMGMNRGPGGASGGGPSQGVSLEGMAAICINAQGTIQMATPEAHALLGYAKGELKGRDMGTLLPPPFSTQHQAYVRAYVQSGIPAILTRPAEFVVLTKTRQVVTVRLTVSKLTGLNEDSIFLGVLDPLPPTPGEARAWVLGNGLVVATDALFCDWLGYGMSELGGQQADELAAEGPDRENLRGTLKSLILASRRPGTSTGKIPPAQMRNRRQSLGEVMGGIVARIGSATKLGPSRPNNGSSSGAAPDGYHLMEAPSLLPITLPAVHWKQKYGEPLPFDTVVHPSAIGTVRYNMLVLRRCAPSTLATLAPPRPTPYSDMVLVADHKGHVLHCTVALAAALGRSMDAIRSGGLDLLLPEPYATLHGPWIRDLAAAQPQDLSLQGTPPPRSCRAATGVCLSGYDEHRGPVPRPFRLTVSQRLVAGGSSRTHTLRFEPLTQEQALSERRLRLTLDLRGRVLATGSAPRELFGAHPREMLGANIASFVDLFGYDEHEAMVLNGGGATRSVGATSLRAGAGLGLGDGEAAEAPASAAGAAAPWAPLGGSGRGAGADTDDPLALAESAFADAAARRVARALVLLAQRSSERPGTSWRVGVVRRPDPTAAAEVQQIAALIGPGDAPMARALLGPTITPAIMTVRLVRETVQPPTTTTAAGAAVKGGATLDEARRSRQDSAWVEEMGAKEWNGDAKRGVRQGPGPLAEATEEGEEGSMEQAVVAALGRIDDKELDALTLDSAEVSAPSAPAPVAAAALGAAVSRKISIPAAGPEPSTYSFRLPAAEPPTSPSLAATRAATAAAAVAVIHGPASPLQAARRSPTPLGDSRMVRLMPQPERSDSQRAFAAPPPPPPRTPPPPAPPPQRLILEVELWRADLLGGVLEVDEMGRVTRADAADPLGTADLVLGVPANSLPGRPLSDILPLPAGGLDALLEGRTDVAAAKAKPRGALKSAKSAAARAKRGRRVGPPAVITTRHGGDGCEMRLRLQALRPGGGGGGAYILLQPMAPSAVPMAFLRALYDSNGAAATAAVPLPLLPATNGTAAVPGGVGRPGSLGAPHLPPPPLPPPSPFSGQLGAVPRPPGQLGRDGALGSLASPDAAAAAAGAVGASPSPSPAPDSPRAWLAKVSGDVEEGSAAASDHPVKAPPMIKAPQGEDVEGPAEPLTRKNMVKAWVLSGGKAGAGADPAAEPQKGTTRGRGSPAPPAAGGSSEGGEESSSEGNGSSSEGGDASSQEPREDDSAAQAAAGQDWGGAGKKGSQGSAENTASAMGNEAGETVANYGTGKRFKKLMKILATPLAQRPLQALRFQSVAAIMLILVIHTVTFVLLFTELNKQMVAIKDLDSVAIAAHEVHDIAIGARLLDQLYLNTTPFLPGIPTFGDDRKEALKTTYSEIHSTMDALRALHHGVYLGFHKLRQMPNKHGLREIWDGHSLNVSIYYDLTDNSTEDAVAVEYRAMGLWDAGNLYIAKALEMYDSAAKRAAQGKNFDNWATWKFIRANGLDVVFPAYMTTLDSMVTLTVDQSHGIESLQLLVLCFEGALLCLLACMYMWITASRFSRKRFWLYSVFIQCPVGVARGLANMSVALEPGDEEDDEAAATVLNAHGGPADANATGLEGGDSHAATGGQADGGGSGMLTEGMIKEMRGTRRKSVSVAVNDAAEARMEKKASTGSAMKGPSRLGSRLLEAGAAASDGAAKEGANGAEAGVDKDAAAKIMGVLAFWRSRARITPSVQQNAVGTGSMVMMGSGNHGGAAPAPKHHARRLMPSRRLSYMLVSPMLLLCTALITINLLGYESLKGMASPIATLNVVNILLIRFNRVLFHVMEVCGSGSLEEMLPFKSDLGMELDSMVNEYAVMLFGVDAVPNAHDDAHFALAKTGVVFGRGARPATLLYSYDGCMCDDPSMCQTEDSPFYQVTHNGLDVLFKTQFSYVRSLINQPFEASSLRSKEFDFLWSTSRSDMECGMLKMNQFFFKEVDDSYRAVQVKQIALLVSVWVWGCAYLWLQLRPTLRKAAHELRRIAELLSQLPPEVNVEAKLTRAINGTDFVEGQDARGWVGWLRSMLPGRDAGLQLKAPSMAAGGGGGLKPLPAIPY